MASLFWSHSCFLKTVYLRKEVPIRLIMIVMRSNKLKKVAVLDIHVKADMMKRMKHHSLLKLKTFFLLDVLSYVQRDALMAALRTRRVS